jgi:hypothetical protein
VLIPAEAELEASADPRALLEAKALALELLLASPLLGEAAAL